MESNYVVLTVRGWDGSRILGVFNNKQSARAAALSLVEGKKNSANNRMSELHKEEFFLDVVNLGQISVGSTITASSESDPANANFEFIVRDHMYT